jgi:hypothetical protein
MEGSPQDAQTWEQWQRSVSTVLAARQDRIAALPPLEPEDKSRLRELLASVLDWFKRHFSSSLPFDQATAANAIKWILIAFALGALTLVAYLLVRWIQSFRAGPAIPSVNLPWHRQSPPVTFAAEQGLVAMLEESLDRGEFALAARLRWRVHLLRTRLPADRTPRECDLPSHEAFYHLMFGPRQAKETVENAFRRFDQSLLGTEGGIPDV